LAEGSAPGAVIGGEGSRAAGGEVVAGGAAEGSRSCGDGGAEKEPYGDADENDDEDENDDDEE
jgi:hypothetical protein